MKMTKYALTIILLLGLLFVGCEIPDTNIENPDQQENTGDNSDDDSGDNTEDNADNGTEDNTGDNTEDNTGDNTEDNTDDSTENNTDDSTEDNTDDSTEDNTGDSTEDNTGDNTEDNTGDNTKEDTEDDDEEGTGATYVMDGPFDAASWVSYKDGYRNDYISFYETDSGYSIYFDIYTNQSNTTLPTGRYEISNDYNDCAYREWSYFTFYNDGELNRFKEGYVDVVVDTEHESGYPYHTINAQCVMDSGDIVTLEFVGTITEKRFEDVN